MNSKKQTITAFAKKLLVCTSIITVLSICTSLSANAQEQFNRGFSSSTFIPKGQWITGVSVNYSQSKQNNYQFFVIEGVNGNTYNFKVSPALFYAFKDDMAAGGRVAYTRSRTKIDGAHIVLSSDNTFDINNLYNINQNYSVMGAFRNYIGLGSSKRFGIITEVQLEYGLGESKIANGSGTDLTGSFARTHSFNVGVCPGMMMFLTNYSALEVNVGVLGFNFSRTHQINNQIYEGNIDSKSASFRLNLLSISFGVMFYL